MKWLLSATFLVGAVWFLASGDGAPDGSPLATKSLLESKRESSDGPQSVPVGIDSQSTLPELNADPNEVTESGEADLESQIIEIGEPIDPEDPSAWSISDANEVVSVGDPIDPEDPAAWSVDRNNEVVNIGEYIDPEDPAAWTVDRSVEVINIGDYVSPEDAATWSVDHSVENINIGEPLDPERQ